MGGRRRGHYKVSMRKANGTEPDSVNVLVCSRPPSDWMGYIGMEIVY